MAMMALRRSAGGEANTRKEGVLEKQGGGTSLFGSKSFKRRYVTIEDGKLTYFATDDMGVKGKQKGEIDLSEFTVRKNESSRLFELHPTSGDSRAYVFKVGKGDGERGFNQWISALLANNLCGEETSRREGILEKQGGGTSMFGSKSFKSRYIIAEDGQLKYFEVDERGMKGKAKGEPLNLSDFLIKSDVPALTFELRPRSGGDRSYAFKVSDSEAEPGLAHWVRACIANGAVTE